MTDTMLQGNQKYDDANVVDVLCVTAHLNPITRFKFITKPPHYYSWIEKRASNKNDNTKKVGKQSGG